ncbi:hypothetical protein H6F77_09835 [Microcoleus sp. FACHB-831]|uniref:competence protein CoiA n=1 Tax=Microcoleus sp. FACHB-831 TaxID=2692827 RepID=UPI001686644A|nr:competence protein CoiA family protein [Microcoleus sp. FACHB-831]MBD1921389.1 hypothetical protein [Microcoleus sp. FACHB-831]
MPLTAWIDDEKVLAPLVSDEDWEAWKNQRDIKISLACCKSSGFLRNSKLGTKHFVHKCKTGCNWKPETQEHLLAKSEIVKACLEAGYEADTEVSGLDWRADVLASKGKVKIAFEIQWSPQTLQLTQERQTKYKRDEIRGCWLFRKLPSSKASKELPMFELALNSNNKFVVHIPTQDINNKRSLSLENISLSEFIKSLLSKKIKFCESYVSIKEQITYLSFFSVKCSQCNKPYHVYMVQETFIVSKSLCGIDVNIPHYSNYGKKLCLDKPFVFASEIVNFARFISKENKNINMGEIKSRYKHNKWNNWLSFGCHWCDAILPYHPDYYNKCKTKHYSYLCTSMAYCIKGLKPSEQIFNKDLGGHWCYPKDENFCT